MRKEVLFAIITGIIFGLVVAFGIIRANKAIKESSSDNSTSDTGIVETTSPTPAVTTLAISLTKPSENEVITENPLTIEGITKANTWIVISGRSKDVITKSDEKGGFSGDIELDPAFNTIALTALEEGQSESEKSINVVYSTEFVKEVAKETQPVSTDEAINKTVQQKIENAINRPTFYIGTITDITNDSFQIKSDSGEIKQISVTPDSTTFIKIGKTSTKVKIAEVAIGDYIIALGYIKDKEVLASSRVLITSPSDTAKKKVILAKVTGTKKGEITADSLSDGKEYKVTPGTSASISQGSDMKKIKFTLISEGDIIIVVGAMKDNSIEATRIHIISSSEPSPTPTVVKKSTPTP